MLTMELEVTAMNKLSFKEELTVEAEMNNLKIDISDKIDYIKYKMKQCVNCRSFTVSLVKANTPMALGVNYPNAVDYFIPPKVSPLHYRKLFIDEFIKLGFAEEDIELNVVDGRYCTYYGINVTW